MVFLKIDKEVFYLLVSSSINK
uniref:Uncharacterized protein n=1 Tax=Arundo donax TaxID=35708 RepID=A0A0A9AU73_ARUDO